MRQDNVMMPIGALSSLDGISCTLAPGAHHLTCETIVGHLPCSVSYIGAVPTAHECWSAVRSGMGLESTTHLAACAELQRPRSPTAQRRWPSAVALMDTWWFMR